MIRNLFLNRPMIRLAVLSGLGLVFAGSPVLAQGTFGGGGSGGPGGAGGSGGSGSNLTPFSSGSGSTPGGGVQSYNQGLFGGLNGTVQGVSAANPLQPYYANPYAFGKPQTSTSGSGGKQSGSGGSSSSLSGNSGSTNNKQVFGQALYPASSMSSNTTTNSGTFGASGTQNFGGKSGMSGIGGGSSGLGSGSIGTGGLGSSGTKFGGSGLNSGSIGSGALGGKSGIGGGALGGGALGGGGLGSNLGGGFGSGNNIGGQIVPNFSTSGVAKNGPYIAELGPTIPMIKPTLGSPAMPGSLHSKVNQVLLSSSQLPSQGKIQVGMQGQIVILNGSVASASEKTLAENMIRLTPGVKDVVNNLSVGGQ